MWFSRCFVSCGVLLAVVSGTPSAEAVEPGRSPHAGSGAAAVVQQQASPAIDGVLTLFARRPVVAIGDAHGLAQEWAFFAALISDPRFAQLVGNVVFELGGAVAQDTLDRYLAGEAVPIEQLRRVWTDTAGAFSPGEPVPLAVVNFLATVRAVNQHLPASQRIKVWLGDPVVDWTQIHSFRDLQPFLRKRGHLFDVLDQEILSKRKKALVIVGLGHLFGPGGQGSLTRSINKALPDSLSIVAPWLGYLESECNDKLAAQMHNWPAPALVAPLQGSWLSTQLQLPGCNFVPAERRGPMGQKGPPQMKRPGGGEGPPKAGPPGTASPVARPPGADPQDAPVMLAGGAAFGGKMPTPEEMNEAEIDIMSGRKADAILYLGPPDTLTQSPIDPSIYLDLEFFKQQDARARCCSPEGTGLDWGKLVRENPVVPKKFDRAE